jgi:hypothetical protein
MINIADISKAQVLAALFNASQPLGLGFLAKGVQDPMSEEDAQVILNQGYLYFDYLRGRVMKVDLSDNQLDPWLYDRDNGGGAALRALEPLLKEKALAPCTDDPCHVCDNQA